MISFFLSLLRSPVFPPHPSSLSSHFALISPSCCCLVSHLPLSSWRSKGLEFRKIMERFAILTACRETQTFAIKRAWNGSSESSQYNLDFAVKMYSGVMYCGSDNQLANRLSSVGALRFHSPSLPTYLCCFLCESTQATTVCGARVLFWGFFCCCCFSGLICYLQRTSNSKSFP